MPNRKNGYRYRFRRAWSFPSAVEEFLATLLVSPSLHVCCGASRLGDVRVDIVTPADVRADAFRLPFRDEAFASVLTDPPWHMPYHLRPRFAKELARVLRHGGVLILNAPWALGLTESFRLEAVYYAEPKAWRNCPLVLVYRRI